MKPTLKIIVKDLELNPIARLENAYKLSYDKQINALWNASFRLPLDDPKNELLSPFYWVDITYGDKYIGLYQVMPKKSVFNRATREITYTLRHALGTLLSKSLFRFHSLTNYDTTYVLQYLMNQQEVKHWKLGKIDFKRKFSYSWENDNLLSALFSVPRPFDVRYQWTWDTTVYPFVLNLIEPSDKPVCRVQEGHNLIGLEINENPNVLFNRIYGLGSGEGRNQLSVEKINGGKPYVENAESIAKYGLQEYVWPDKRFVHADNLLASMKGKLEEWKQPKVTWEVRAARLADITGLSIDEFEMGQVVQIKTKKFGTIDQRIVKERMDDVTGNPGEMTLSIGGVIDDLSTSQTDLEHRQQINELNAQGATTLLSDSFMDNCDDSHPATMDLFFDSDMVYINTVELTLKTKPFRANSQATKGGGATVSSTSAGGASTQTSSSGGGSTQTSSSGGGSTQTSSAAGQATSTSSAGGNHAHKMFRWQGTTANIEQFTNCNFIATGNTTWISIPTLTDADLWTDESAGNHSHSVTTPAHQHSVSIPNHQHSLNIPNHTHSVSIPNHTHAITLPDHNHEIKYGIYEDHDVANKLQIKIDGTIVDITATSGQRIDIVDYLQKESGSGDIVRGNHTIEILPNKRARIEAKVYARVFIQSQIGGKF